MGQFVLFMEESMPDFAARAAKAETKDLEEALILYDGYDRWQPHRNVMQLELKNRSKTKINWAVVEPRLWQAGGILVAIAAAVAAFFGLG